MLAEESAPTIGEIVDSLKRSTGIKDKRIIKTYMYKEILSPKITLEEYLNKPNTDHAMFGSWRGYMSFISSKLERKLLEYGQQQRINGRAFKTFTMGTRGPNGIGKLSSGQTGFAPGLSSMRTIKEMLSSPNPNYVSDHFKQGFKEGGKNKKR